LSCSPAAAVHPAHPVHHARLLDLRGISGIYFINIGP
jgi:hypothetical protein